MKPKMPMLDGSNNNTNFKLRYVLAVLFLAVPLLILVGCGNSGSKEDAESMETIKRSKSTQGSRVVVSTAAAGKLLLVNPADAQPIESFSVPANIHGAAVAGNKLFAGDRKGKGIYSVSLSERKSEQKEPDFISLEGPGHHLASTEKYVVATVTMKNYVAVVNAKTEKLEAKIPVPKPYYPLVVPERNRLYVTSKSTGSVQVIDLETRQVVDTISVGKAPSHLAYDGNRLWVTNAGSGDVSVVNLISKQEITRISTGTDPHGVAYDAETKLVFVSNRGDGSLSIVDADQLEQRENLKTGGMPGHLTSVDDRILVGLPDPGAIDVLNPSTLEVERTLKVGMEPHQMVVVPETI